jgi:hypothetical protein
MRASRVPLLILVTAFAAVPACAQDGWAEHRGQQLVSKHCAMRHAIGRRGNSPHRQAPSFRTLAKRYPIESLPEARGVFYTGRPDMPEFVFTPADIGAIPAMDDRIVPVTPPSTNSRSRDANIAARRDAHEKTYPDGTAIILEPVVISSLPC